MDFAIYLFFGLIAGDYLLQPKKMAFYKSDKYTMGFWYCYLHSVIFTAAIGLFLYLIPIGLNRILGHKVFEVYHATQWFYFIVFFSHYIIDRYSLAQKWLDMIRGRNIIKAWQSNDIYREIDIPFSAIVYVIVDNGLHYMIMWYAFKICGGIN
jgi:hypothetical protein